MDSNYIDATNSSDKEDNKKIDNRIITSKEKIGIIDNKIDETKKKIKNLSDMQDNVVTIAKSMNKCIDLLAKSLSGPRINNKFSDMRNSNATFLRKASSSIEEEIMNHRKVINELYKEKDTIIKENRNNYNKEEQTIKEQEAIKEAKHKMFNKEENIFINDSEKPKKRK